MKVNNKKKNDKETVRINIGVSILLAVVLSFVSIGYAVYGQKLNVLGNITFENNQGVVAITEVTFVTASSYNASANPAPSVDGQSIDFNLEFAKEQGTTHNDYRAVFEITIENDTYYDYGFNLANFQPVITNSQGIPVEDELTIYLAADGPQLGDTIPAGESITFQVYMDFAPTVDDTYTVEGDMNTDLEEQPHGSIVGNVPQNSSGNLQESLNHDIVAFTIDVISTFSSQKTFTLSISDPVHFKLVNQDGTPLSSFTIAAHDDETYTFYVARVANAVYANSTYELTINLLYDDESDDCGTIELVVDEAQIEDTTPPKISSVTATKANASTCTTSETAIGQVKLEWNSTIPDSGIKNFYVKVYNTSNGTSQTLSAGTNLNQNTGKYSYTVTGLIGGNYYFQVYGVNNDEHGATDQEISNYGATSGNSVNYNWKYSVALSSDSTNTQAISNNVVHHGCTYTTTLQAKASDSSYNYYLPTSITVSMVGTNSPQYTYNPGSNATSTTLTISSTATGNITITSKGTASEKGLCG